jgi:hypothetical protein
MIPFQNVEEATLGRQKISVAFLMPIFYFYDYSVHAHSPNVVKISSK